MIDLKYGYYLDYEHQSCFDDGGLGHDLWWEKSSVPLHEAKNDKEAKALAKKILSNERPCGGSFCDNKGLKRVIGNGLYYVETKMQVTTRKIDL